VVREGGGRSGRNLKAESAPRVTSPRGDLPQLCAGGVGDGTVALAHVIAVDTQNDIANLRRDATDGVVVRATVGVVVRRPACANDGEVVLDREDPGGQLASTLDVQILVSAWRGVVQREDGAGAPAVTDLL
jgi:hypothetical protein